MNRRAAVATFIAGAVMSVLATACGQPPSAESAALADVIRDAQTAELNLETVDQVQTELAKYYVGTLLTRKVTEHQDAIRATANAGGGARIGGVKGLDLKDVRVSGQTAKVRAQVTLWFKTAQFSYQPVASQPAATNVVDLDLHLVRDAGGWKIDQEQWQFAPGGGP
jgi:hypothetical protein